MFRVCFCLGMATLLAAGTATAQDVAPDDFVDTPADDPADPPPPIEDEGAGADEAPPDVADEAPPAEERADTGERLDEPAGDLPEADPPPRGSYDDDYDAGYDFGEADGGFGTAWPWIVVGCFATGCTTYFFPFAIAATIASAVSASLWARMMGPPETVRQETEAFEDGYVDATKSDWLYNLIASLGGSAIGAVCALAFGVVAYVGIVFGYIAFVGLVFALSSGFVAPRGGPPGRTVRSGLPLLPLLGAGTMPMGFAGPPE